MAKDGKLSSRSQKPIKIRTPSILELATTADNERPVRKLRSLHGRKPTPIYKFLGTAGAYFVCHIGPNFQISLIFAFIGCPQSVLRHIYLYINMHLLFLNYHNVTPQTFIALVFYITKVASETFLIFLTIEIFFGWQRQNTLSKLPFLRKLCICAS